MRFDRESQIPHIAQCSVDNALLTGRAPSVMGWDGAALACSAGCRNKQRLAMTHRNNTQKKGMCDFCKLDCCRKVTFITRRLTPEPCKTLCALWTTCYKIIFECLASLGRPGTVPVVPTVVAFCFVVTCKIPFVKHSRLKGTGYRVHDYTSHDNKRIAVRS